MPMGKGTYGSKKGRPPMKGKKKSAMDARAKFLLKIKKKDK